MKENKAAQKLAKARARHKHKRDSLKLKMAERIYPSVETGLSSAQAEERTKAGLVNTKTSTGSKSYTFT